MWSLREQGHRQEVVAVEVAGERGEEEGAGLETDNEDTGLNTGRS